MIRLLLVDVGGVILSEDELYSVLLASQKKALRVKGVEVTDEEFDTAVREAILSFVPNLQRAVAWRFTKPDVSLCDRVTRAARSAFTAWHEAQERELVPGIREALTELARTYTLALAANQDASIRGVLALHGMLSLFAESEVSEDIGLSKPDPRFFAYLVRKCGVKPRETIMIGDRLDNDLIPARAAGLRTILFKTGPYTILEPRTPEEIPHETITDMRALPEAVHAIQERQRN